ncbi:MAG: CDGSH iron-sulfur domain-containing protein [Rhodobacteraceae bacterium]|jgi:CDGSH iron-sulfur domain-containing protein 3|nr:CDGSH iron-sulfur domain-containing protein [Paracoccaceae bacterium]
MSEAPHIAQTAPYKSDLQGEKSYFWCACGQSKNQPFCDGSHKGTSFTPLKFEVEVAKTAFLCGCKHTANAPYCDGSHKALIIPTA